tara:strand:+ start:232 stop:597 length:366 start_codon:yes stop_codon:yes gene_type:complete
MAQAVGYGGNVTFASGYVVHVRSWTLDYEGEALEVTDFGDAGVAAYIPGVKRWSGSYECVLDDTTVTVAPGAAAASATFTIATSQTLGGSIIVTAVRYSVDTQGLAIVTFDFQGSGALTIT